MREFTREIELEALVRIADARMQRRQMPPAGRRVTALLDELALRGRKRFLSALYFSRRQLVEMFADGVAKLSVVPCSFEEDVSRDSMLGIPVLLLFSAAVFPFPYI